MVRGQDQLADQDARDNVVAAVARILKFKSANIEAQTVFNSWIKHLPAKVDVQEARFVNGYLADTIINNAELAYKKTPENIPVLAKRILLILQSKTVRGGDIERMRECLEVIWEKAKSRGETQLVKKELNAEESALLGTIVKTDV